MATEAAIISTINGLLADSVVGDASAADLRASLVALGTLDELAADTALTASIAASSALITDNFHGRNDLAIMRSAMTGIVDAIAADVVADGGTADTTSLDAQIAAFGIAERPTPGDQAALLIVILAEVVSWVGTVPSPPPVSDALADLNTYIFDSAYEVTVMDNLVAGAQTDPVNQVSLYNMPIYGGAWLWAGLAQVTAENRNRCWGNLLDIQTRIIAEATNEVPSSTATTGHDNDNGYSVPNTNYGAEVGYTYLTWPGCTYLWGIQWAAALMQYNDVILRSGSATVAMKNQAKTNFLWAAKHVVERYGSSQGVLHAQVAEEVERMVAGTVPYNNRWSQNNVCIAYINYWYPIWSMAIPDFLTQLYPGESFARHNYIEQVKDGLGLWDPLDTTPILALTKVKSWEITDPGGYVYIDEPGIYDTGHAFALKQLIDVFRHLDVAAGDTPFEDLLDDYYAALQVNFQLQVTETGGGCIEISEIPDGTNPDPLNNDALIVYGDALEAIGIAPSADKLAKFVLQVAEGGVGACWDATSVRHADAANFANISAISAYAEKLADEGGTTDEQRAKMFIGV